MVVEDGLCGQLFRWLIYTSRSTMMQMLLIFLQCLQPSQRSLYVENIWDRRSDRRQSIPLISSQDIQNELAAVRKGEPRCAKDLVVSFESKPRRPSEGVC